MPYLSPLLLIGDLHLTDRPKDAYRFDIFNWIRDQQVRYEPEATFLLGDITDQKDKHHSSLVNKIVDGLNRLAKPVYILRGNHDGIDPTTPFFKFLNSIEGLEFVTLPKLLRSGVAMIPHCREEADFKRACESFGKQAKYLFIHQTIEGAIAESGSRLSGFSAAPIEAMHPTLGTYAGDVHKPQDVGAVTYVGSPYTIRFGDDFEPRCLLLSKNAPMNLYFDCIRKWVLHIRGPEDILNNQNLLKGDQVKLNIELAREEAVEWKAHKQKVLTVCQKMGLEVFGVAVTVSSATPKAQTASVKGRSQAEIIEAFCTAEKVPSAMRKAALSLLS